PTPPTHPLSLHDALPISTIGPPFLDENTLVDSNAGRGFMQTSPLPNPESAVVIWPHAMKNGSAVDMRRLTSDPDPNVVSYTIDGDRKSTRLNSSHRTISY